ncbi:hypothetical protein CTAYLR_009855 [Chrysophaeum taylorii]|uniref:Fe2OG dioxygenase domain-containing protein n=1 Tax=Chrysophaeum taylorii TaxID=2483200 RepID=A0AAD7U5Y4_9STRA|nr:hypothetical protein CTAYLR_009855 [Chrysophaeum taylorii]
MDDDLLVLLCGVTSLSCDDDDDDESEHATARRQSPSWRCRALRARRRACAVPRVAKRVPFARRLRGEHLAAGMTLTTCAALSADARSRAQLEDTNNPSRAARELRRAARLCDDDDEAARLFAALALCEIRLGAPRRALAACDEAPCETAAIARARATAHSTLLEFDRAARWCERAIHLGDKAHYALGVCHLGRLDHAAAYRAFARGFLDGGTSSVLDDARRLETQLAKRLSYYPRVAPDLDTVARKLAAYSDTTASCPPSFVFKTAPVLVDPRECDALVAAAVDADVWRSDRHGAHPTCDVAVVDLGAEALAIVNRWLEHVLLPLAAARAFQNARTTRGLAVHDAFVVKYCAESAAHAALPIHQDQALVSMTVGLNPLADYEGGGLWFEHHPDTSVGTVVPCDRGQAVVFASSLRHAALAVTQGQRFVLALFLYRTDNDGDHEERPAASSPAE